MMRSWSVRGLSPRVRGNRIASVSHSIPAGSIPACAGEPPGLGIRSGSLSGLSPRVRGNHGKGNTGDDDVRSIPACAGEPGAGLGSRGWRRVYPRVCGGTPGRTTMKTPAGGLSPRVRGNPRGECHRRHCHRSIPACAGEPSGGRPGKPGQTVYPRVCGGTTPTGTGTTALEGLSPRVRGNPGAHYDENASWGSIPACAGEPSGGRPGKPGQTVYPRVCGGTVSSRTAS